MKKGTKQSRVIKLIDPPMGWACGFPKEFPDGVTDVKKWLVDNGYPESLINTLGEGFHYRIIEKSNHKTK